MREPLQASHSWWFKSVHLDWELYKAIGPRFTNFYGHYKFLAYNLLRVRTCELRKSEKLSGFYRYLSFFFCSFLLPYFSLCLVVVTVSSYAVIFVHFWVWTNPAVTSCTVNMYLPYGVSSTVINSFQKHISKPSSHNSLLAILLKN